MATAARRAAAIECDVRVLHVQRASGVSGSERHLLTLLPALLERGVDVRMAVVGFGRAGDLVGELRARKVDVVAWRAGGHLSPGLVARLVNEMRRFRPDLVHTHLIHADLHGQVAAALARVPGVSSVHSTHSFYAREPYRSAAALAARLATRTIAISHAVAELLERERVASRDRLRVVHYGIDASGWHADAGAATARERLGLSADDVVVGVASRLVPHKGHDLLLRAMARAHGRDRRLRLLVAGDGPLRRDIETTAAALLDPAVVRFLGFVEDMPAFMAMCDVIAFPSQPEFGEGFGLAALEAMAAGRPLVATAAGPLPEVVDHGRTGLLVEPHESEMAEALLTLAADTPARVRMGEAARLRAQTSFSVSAMAERTLEVYRVALAESGRRRGGGLRRLRGTR